VFLKKLIFKKNNNFFYISDRFDLLVSKIIFKNKKNIILIHLGKKSTLKSNHNHTPKQAMIAFQNIFLFENVFK
jgi:hypothetical protein